MKRYDSENEIFEVVRGFENATIDRDVWRHAEHLTVALYYVMHHDIETATAKMRDGILKLLREGFAIDLTKEMPYHETLTIFWMRTVADFNASTNGCSLLEKANKLVEAYDKDYPLKFYTHEVLFSDRLRSTYVPGDRVGPRGPI
jgi:hypothetical protein